jgi:4-amino-4-deoxy-L-arabinose transferase-like glycosyltransferase
MTASNEMSDIARVAEGAPAADGAETAAEAAAREAPDPRWLKWAPGIAAGVAALFILLPIGQSGIWDPFELNVADLSRRIAIHVLGASSVSLTGADNSMPRLSDLGRGELPFDSIAFGFRLFGLHEWSGRLPLALWGLLGVAALYVWLARLVDRRAGLYGALILASMPLYFMQARTMLGDIVLMAAVSVGFAGLGLATFDASLAKRWRIIALVGGVVALAAGFMTRGLLLGVTVPTLGVGLSWAIVVASSPRKPEWFGDAVGAACLLVGAVAAFAGTSALMHATASEYSVWAGTAVSSQPKFPTFDYVILYLGHSLFPWSAFIPFAVGRLFRSPPRPPSQVRADASESDASDRAGVAQLTALVGSAVAFGVYSIAAPRIGYVAFGAPALLAAIAAICIHDFDRGAPSSRAIGVGVAVLTALYLRDFVMFPEKGLSAFAVNSTTFPDSFKDRASSLILWASAAFTIGVFFSWLEEDNRPWFKLGEYLEWPRSLLRAFGGNLIFALAAVQIGLVLLAAVMYVELHWVHARPVLELGLQTRLVLLNAFWVFPVALFLPVWGTMALRDGFRLIFDRTGFSRAMATVVAGVIAGALLSFVYYPALAAQLSPKEVFDSYRRFHKPGEPLGLLGVGGKSATYYSGGDVKAFGDPNSAFAWLTATPERHWLAVRNEDLGKLNSMFRARPGPKHNLPVLDARSSQILLVSNLLLPQERNESPFSNMVLDSEPPIHNRVEANLQDQLLSLGWEVTDMAGKPVDVVSPARKYHFRLLYKVLANVPGEWETFIHIDGFHRRFNGDHKTLDGKYAFNLWQVGDYILDDHEFSLEPNFTPGAYNIFYGLFVGETRMKVKTGRQDDNRVDGGTLRVQ